MRYKKDFPRRVNVIRLAMASRLVNRPVLSEKIIRRLIMVSDRLKPVREVCK